MESDSGSESSLNGRNTEDPPKRRRVGLLYDDRMCKHETPDGEYHPENPNRIRVIWDKLNSSGIAQRCVILNAKEVEDNHLALVHTKNHIDLIKKVSSKNSDSRRKRVAATFNSIYFNEGSSEAACLAVGSVIEVAEKVAKGELDSGFAIVRPPGHHAEKAEPMGFCLYNNVSVATSYLLNERPELGISKILIVDWDVHHGNGTQKMFYKDPRALIFSVHRHEFGSFYPATDDGSYTMTGEGPGAGYNINVPWENGRCGDADYIAVWDHILIPVVKEFNPDMIIISAGFDAAMGDPLGGCRVSPFGYSIMLDKLMDFAGGKIVMALEGGYNLNSLANSAQACVEVLLQHKPITGSVEAYPFESTWRVIQVVRQELSEYWSTLAAKLPYKVISHRTSHLEISSSDSDGDNENSSHSVIEELDVVENFMQPFANLKVHETGQDQEATTASPSWRSELSKIDIWYATYGSNMNMPRFCCYIEGGQTEGMRKPCVGAMDKSTPKEIMWKTFPHRLFFARDRTTTWGPGGVAFLHPNSNVQEKTYMCLYKITLEQFNDVFLQENVSSYNMECPLFDLTALQSIETEKCISVRLVQRGWYHNVLYLGKENNIPILTMTCTLSDVDNFTSGKFPITPPCKEYANTLVKGLVEGKQLTEEEALAYINEASNKPLKKHANWRFVDVRKVHNGEEMVKLSFEERLAKKQAKVLPPRGPVPRESTPAPTLESGVETEERSPPRSPLRRLKKGRRSNETSEPFRLRDDDILVDINDVAMPEVPEHTFDPVQQSFDEMFGPSNEGDIARSEPPPPPPRQSVMNNIPPGIGVSVARSICFGADMEMHHSKPMLSLYEEFCNSSLQAIQTQQAIFDKACIVEDQSRSLNNQLLELQSNFNQLQLENQNNLHRISTFDEEMKSQNIWFEEEKKGIETSWQARMEKAREEVESSWQARMEEARQQSILDYQNSAEFARAQKQLRKESVRAFKRSARGIDWVEERGAEYFTKGYTRSMIQFQQSGLFPTDSNLDFCIMKREMPGEYQVPPITGNEEEDEDSE